MTFKPWVAAAALTVFSVAAQAASHFGALGPGEHVLDIMLTDPSSPLFEEQVSFTLNQGSQVKATLTGVTLSAVSYRDFTEAGGTQLVSVKSTMDAAGSAFDLGALRGGIGFDPTSYNLQLSGLVNAPGATTVRMTLKVSAIPETSTWAMFALGMAGLAAVGRKHPPSRP
jgi:hypothetical protein